MIAFGGLVFNIGNIAGCGLGLNVLTGIDAKTGAVISLFIVCSTMIFIALGNPVKLLVLAGTVYELILPIALAVMLQLGFEKL